MQRRALYFFNDPSGCCLRHYAHIRSRYLVLGGTFHFCMSSKVPISTSPSISGFCAWTNLSFSTCLFICACVSTSVFCICIA
jgi:hypothetical protein